MDYIFGLINRDGSPIDRTKLNKVSSLVFNDQQIVLIVNDSACLGMLASGDKLAQTSGIWTSNNLIYAVSARIDNRSDLAEIIGLTTAERSTVSDPELIARVYQQIHENAPKVMYGDWSFACWDISAQSLFLARDHYGYTALYYYMDHKTVAFASSPAVLLALDLTPARLDEFYLAKVLTCCDFDGDATIRPYIKRLPPAHSMSATSNTDGVECYWRMEDVTIKNFKRRADYVDSFRELFSEAVACRIRSDEPTAVTMSGGLDSSSVAAIASSLLKQSNRSLTAYTAVPMYETGKYVANRFADEYPLAKMVASHTGNIDLIPLNSSAVSPIAAIRRMIEIQEEPCIGAANLFWILDVRATARDSGIKTLLSGAAGNPGVSWTGLPVSQPFFFQWRQMCAVGMRKELISRLKKSVRNCLPAEVLAFINALRGDHPNPLVNSAINPDFASRIGIVDLIRKSRNKVNNLGPLDYRLQILEPGRTIAGSYQALLASAYNLDIRDPTADVRLISYCLSVPDHVYIDPESGIDRWLIREAMRGGLPDEVRLNRRRGRQAGDIVPRLRASALEVENALREIEIGPAAEYLNVNYMRTIWQRVLTEDSPAVFMLSRKVLARGIESGLFVNRFFGYSSKMEN